MTSTQSRIGQAVTQQALFSASGLGAYIGPLQFVGTSIAKLFGVGRKGLVSPFRKRTQLDGTNWLVAPIGSTVGDAARWHKTAQGKRNLKAVVEIEQWFNRLVTRPGDPQAGGKFLLLAAELQEDFPWAFAALQPEVRGLVEQAIGELLSAPMVVAPTNEQRTMLAVSSEFEPSLSVERQGGFGAQSVAAAQALSIGTNFVSSQRPPINAAAVIPYKSAEPQAIASAIGPADSPSTPAARPSVGVLVLFAALAAALVLR